MYVLDSKIIQRNEECLEDIGAWLSRKWTACRKRKTTAERRLEKEGLNEAEVRAQWADQVAVQTRPKPRTSIYVELAYLSANLIDFSGQSRAAGKKAAYEIETAQEVLKKANPFLESMKATANPNAALLNIIAAVSDGVEELSNRWRRLREALQMSVGEPLEAIRFDTFYTAQINALSVKMRLRSRLIERKFEIERVERAYRQAILREFVAATCEIAANDWP